MENVSKLFIYECQIYHHNFKTTLLYAKMCIIVKHLNIALIIVLDRVEYPQKELKITEAYKVITSNFLQCVCVCVCVCVCATPRP